jgi:hypothetical protein
MNVRAFWSETDTETLLGLLEWNAVCPVPRERLFVSTIRNELRRRARGSLPNLTVHTPEGTPR